MVVDTPTSLSTEYFTIKDPVIRKGKHIDTLEITVKKHEELQTITKQLSIRLKASEAFGVGYKNNQIIRLQVSNILLRPTWWTTWQGVFGPYSQEKYQMWAMIYHESADGYLDYRYNYKNMPTAANASFYPTTFVFIQQLKKYFTDNVVYEGGNPDNPRVTIPYQF